MRGHDSQRTSRSPARSFNSACIWWKVETGGPIQTSPVIDVDGTIYVSSSDSCLYAFNPDGTTKWSALIGVNPYSSPAIAVDGTIYIGIGDSLCAISSNGDIIWAYDTGITVNSSPLIGSDGTIYFGADQSKQFALNPDGSLKWKLERTKYGRSYSPALGHNGVVYAGMGNFYLYAIDSTGTVKWGYRNKGFEDLPPTPTIGPDGIIYKSDRFELIALFPHGGKKWSFGLGKYESNLLNGRGDYSSAVIDFEGTIYVGTTGGILYAVRDDGTEKWRVKISNREFYTSVIAGDGTVYTGTLDGYLIALRSDGTEKWRLDIGSPVTSFPAIGSDGTLYVGCEDGSLCAVGMYKGSSLATRESKLYFGSVQLGYSRSIILTLSNGGDAPLHVTSITLTSSDFSVLPNSLIIPPDSSVDVTVTFTPFISGERIGTLTIHSNDIDKPAYTVALSANLSLDNSPWPMRGHDIQNTGQSNYNGISLPLIKWKARGNCGGSDTSPVIGPDNTIYVGDNYSYYTLKALRPDGTRKWYYTIGCKIRSSAAVAPDTTVYISGENGKLHALHPNGLLKWTYQLGGGVGWSSPVITADGTIYIGSFDGYLYALNPDGTFKWKFDTGYEVLSTPAVGHDGTVYVNTSHWGHISEAPWGLYALNADGTQKWFLQTGRGADSSPSVGDDGTIYLTDFDGHLYAVNPDGSVKWIIGFIPEIIVDIDSDVWYSGSPSISSDGTIYVASNMYYLCALNTNGIEKWRFRLDGFIHSAHAIGAGGTVYIGSGGSDKLIYAINPDGSLKWKYQMDEHPVTSPAIGADGTVYIGTGYNYLYAFGRGQGTRIAFSDNRPDFGTVEIGSTVQFPLTVFNAGDEPLIITDFLSSSEEFSASPDSFVVQVDMSIEIILEYTPSTGGLKEEYFVILSNDATEPRRILNVKGNTAIGIKDNKLPHKFSLSQNIPNPFNPKTCINFQIPKTVQIKLEIYSIIGQKVRTLVNEIKSPGFYSANWDGRNEYGIEVSSGVYLYRITMGDKTFTKKMLLMR